MDFVKRPRFPMILLDAPGRDKPSRIPTSAAFYVVSGCGVLALMLCGAWVGPEGVSLEQFNASLVREGLHGWAGRVLIHLRLPRVVVAATTGAALSMAGAALQTWLRNPIADVGVLGISAWGAFGAIVVVYVGRLSGALWVQPIAATLASLMALGALFVSARRHASSERLLLLGIGLGALGSSLVSLVLCLALPDWKASRQILAWLLGSLDGKTWVHAASALPLAFVGGALLLQAHHDLDALRLGSLEAASLGVDVPRLSRKLLCATGLLAGAAAAGAGAIGFVGVIVPYLVRGRTAPRHLQWLAKTGILGAAFLVFADTLARVVPGASNVQLGVVTGLLGAPIIMRQLLANPGVRS